MKIMTKHFNDDYPTTSGPRSHWKVGMVGILNNPASSMNSHSAGWNEVVRSIIADQMGECDILTESDDWDDYDRLIINHGPNYKAGTFNVVGGIGQEVLYRSEKLIDFVMTGKYVNQIDGFQFDEFIKKRQLGFIGIGEIPPISFYDYEKTLIGDSHSISVWPGIGYNLNRNDGKTLYGFLKNPVKADFYYFGNIDIRFHLARQSNPIEATYELVSRYLELANKHGAKVSCLLPVESEDRKMPGTGLYKGQKFFGPAELRRDLVEIFNMEVILWAPSYHTWPQKWYEDLAFYEREVMEPRQSVHIRPRYYAKREH